jgi:hypothetical protein
MGTEQVIQSTLCPCIPKVLSSNLGMDSDYIIRFEVFRAVTMKNAVFLDVTPCRSCVNRRFGGTYRLHLQGRKIWEQGTSVNKWLQTEQALRSSET